MKPWNVVVDGAKYEIKPKGTKVVVNGEKKKLKNLMSKKDGMWKIYELPLGAKKAEIYVNTWGWRHEAGDGRCGLCDRKALYGTEASEMGVSVSDYPSGIYPFPYGRGSGSVDGIFRYYGNDFRFLQQ